MISVIVIGGRPALYLLIGLIAAVLLLIGYVIAAPADRDQPFRRVYALLCLILNRGSAPYPASCEAEAECPRAEKERQRAARVLTSRRAPETRAVRERSLSKLRRRIRDEK